MEQKYMLRFNDNTVHKSVSYILVSEFNIIPSILQAKINDNGGAMILSLKGNEADVKAAVERLKRMGITVHKLANQITRDMNKCIDCGSCISVCPSGALFIDRDTWEVKLSADLCIACASCLTACPAHALKLTLPC